MMPRVDGTETGSLSEFTGAVTGRHNPTKTQLKKNQKTGPQSCFRAVQRFSALFYNFVHFLTVPHFFDKPVEVSITCLFV